MRRKAPRIIIHNTVATASAITSAVVTDFRNVTFSVIPSTDYAGKIKFMGAIKKRDTDNPVAFAGGTDQGAPEGTATDPWMYIDVNDLEDGASIDGDTGLVFSGTGTIRMVEMNTNALDGIAVFITDRTAGTVTVICMLTTNE